LKSNSTSLRVGGEKEFKKLFNTHSKKLYDIACRHVSSNDAEDIVQDLFIELWEKRVTINVQSSWDGYLFSVLKYRIFRFLDKRNELDDALSEALHFTTDKKDILAFEQLYTRLIDTVESLPEQGRAIIQKRYFENKKIQEIALEMGISTETVKTHLKRSFRIMRLQMKDALAGFLFM